MLRNNSVYTLDKTFSDDLGMGTQLKNRKLECTRSQVTVTCKSKIVSYNMYNNF
jgi:hypothetical protein